MLSFMSNYPSLIRFFRPLQSRYWKSNYTTTPIPPPPTNCCEKGCHNCVWIKYAESLSNLYKDTGKATEEVLKQVTDPSLKAFLILELKNRLKK